MASLFTFQASTLNVKLKINLRLQIKKIVLKRNYKLHIQAY